MYIYIYMFSIWMCFYCILSHKFSCILNLDAERPLLLNILIDEIVTHMYMVKIKFVTVPQHYATKVLDTTSLSLAKLDGNYTYIYI